MSRNERAGMNEQERMSRNERAGTMSRNKRAETMSRNERAGTNEQERTSIDCTMVASRIDKRGLMNKD